MHTWRRRETAYPVPAKIFLKLNPDMAMLFAPFGCTHPPSLVLLFLLMQNLSARNIPEMT